MERELDRAEAGPTWLKDPRVAGATVEVLFTAQDKWKLYAWVIMSNHVHALLKPHKPICEVTRAIKSSSGRIANDILGRSGERFWQEESYDHWVRNSDEFSRIVKYIERNPVKAGLVEHPQDWPWSSATVGQVSDLPDVLDGSEMGWSETRPT
ncbi:MAG: REP-associated tyrosine transposase [Bryobacteraceae bacterium]